MGELYKLDFPNGKAYIGITEKTATVRFKGHALSASRPNVRKNNTPIYNAWRKHGAPKLTVLAVVENYDLAETEKRAIAIFNTLVPNGYNVLEGGQVCPGLTKSVAEKISATLTGRVHPCKGKAGKPHTEESKKKMSDWRKGKPGNKHTLESKKAIADALTGIKRSEESRLKMSLAKTGRKLSEETKRKMSESHKRRFKNVI